MGQHQMGEGEPQAGRRQGDAAMLQMIQQVHDGQNDLRMQMLDVKTGLTTAITKLITESFPDGDPGGHRRYHEASIKAAEDKAAFWGKLKDELAKYGLAGFVGWAFYALWQAFLKGPNP